MYLTTTVQQMKQHKGKYVDGGQEDAQMKIAKMVMENARSFNAVSKFVRTGREWAVSNF